MRLRRISAGLACALALGCGGEPAATPRAAGDVPPPADTALPTIPDSPALSAPGGVTVWFSGSRLGTDAAGRSCTERGLVIVRDSTRKLVPLLMTGDTPVLLNDSTLRAHLWRDCRPVGAYDVSLRTGTPVRAR